MDEVATFHIFEVSTDALSVIIQIVFYKVIPIIGLAVIAIVAYRRWYVIMQDSYLSTRGQQHQLSIDEVPPRGIEMQRIDDNGSQYQTTITPSNSTSKFDWTMRKVSLAWFCPATFVLLSIMNFAAWAVFHHDSGPGIVNNFLGSCRLFTCLGALAATNIHDFYLAKRQF